MFTVIVAFDASGKSSTRRPLGIVYSRMPSTSCASLRLAGLVSGFQPGAAGRCCGIGRAFGLSPARGFPGAALGVSSGAAAFGGWPVPASVAAAGGAAFASPGGVGFGAAAGGAEGLVFAAGAGFASVFAASWAKVVEARSKEATAATRRRAGFIGGMGETPRTRRGMPRLWHRISVPFAAAHDGEDEMRSIGATLAMFTFAMLAATAHAQHFSGHLVATSPMVNGPSASIEFECSGSDPCLGSMRGTLQPHGCSNYTAVSGPISITGGLAPASPGPVTLTFTASGANPDDIAQPDGTCTFAPRNKDFVVTLGGHWDGVQGTVSGTFTDNDGFVSNIVASYATDASAPFRLTVTSSIGATATATASVQFASSLVGTTQSVYVFALAPPAVVKSAAGTKVDSTLPCVLAQLDAAGQLVAVSAESLQAYVTGVIASGAQAYTILNNVPTVNIGGATFMLGVGQSGASAIASNATRAAITVPGSVACKAEAPQTGWWWNDKEGGRGFSIEARDGKLFFAGYLYDAAGQATWLAAAGPTTLEGSVFQGDLVAYANGQTMTGTYKAPAPQPSPGRITLTFSDSDHGVLSWPGGNVALRRFEIVASSLTAPPAPVQPESGWWWNDSEAGRGYFIEWQGTNAFLATYLYTLQGAPIWYASQAATPDLFHFNGTLTTFTGGQTLTGPYRAPTGSSSAGNVDIAFTGPDTAVLLWPNGVRVPIKRFRF